MNKWIKYKLSNVADVKLSNVDKKSNEAEKVVRLCNYTDVYKNSFINSEKAKTFMVASCSEIEYERFKLKKGQVAITKDSETRDDIGVSTYISEDIEDVVLGYHTSLITPDESKLNGCFLHYWFNTRQAKSYFENNSGGSGQRCTLPLDIIKSIPLFLPDLKIQNIIAAVLSTLDAKIALNNRINAQLEAMAKTLYDFWFVQFDCPDATGKPYKANGGKMVWNKELKREIPEGWEVKTLTEIAPFIIRGISPNYVEEDGICVLNQKCIRDRAINFEPARRHNAALKDASSKLLKIGDVLVNSTGFGTLGRVAIVKRLQELITTVDSHITIVRCEGVNIKKLYLGYSMLERQSEIEGLAEGSTGQTELSRANLGKLKMVIPPIDLQFSFENFIKPLFKIMANNEEQNQLLSSLRDWLLPMLMNGQVRVGLAD